MNNLELRAGQRVRITQEIERREGPWKTVVSGEILSAKAESTESWFAHGKDDKLWLMRIRLRKDDGELTTLTIDRHSLVEILSDAPTAK